MKANLGVSANRWAVFKAAWAKTFIELRRYMFNAVSGLITMCIIFLLLFFGAKAVGGSAFQTGGGLEGIVVGYMVWIFAISSYQDLAFGISSEAETGTLEQLYLSPFGFAWVNASLTIARFVINLVLVAVVLVFSMAVSGRWLRFDFISLAPVVLLTVAAPYGIGFILGGLALIFKRIQNAFQILTFGLIAFVALPVDRFPWAKFLPLALGNDLLRKIMADGARLWELPLGDLLLAAAVGLGYFLLGLAGFVWCARIARDRGLLGQY